MKQGVNFSKGVAALMLGGVLAPCLAVGQTLGAKGAVSQLSAGDERHVINLENVEIQLLIDDVSAITGYTFIVHPTVRGKVTVVSQTPLTTAEVFQVFLSTLRVNGFTLIPGQNGIYKIVPEQAATAEAGLASPRVSGDQVETAIFRLDNIEALEAAKMIKPLTNSQGQLIASPVSNAVIVVDYAANISRVRQLVAEIDEDRSGVLTVSLENTSAAEMAKTVTNLVSGTNSSFDLDVGAVAVDASNSVVIRGDQIDVTRMAQIVRDLDLTAQRSQETVTVRKLRFANAEEIAPIIEALGVRMAAANFRADGETTPPSVVVHAPTNSLIINASPRMLEELEEVVDQLDVRRPQVLVEAIVVELSDDAVRELGLQFVLAGADNSNLPFAATNFSTATPNVLALSGALVQDGFESDSGSDGGALLADLAVSSLLGANGGLFGIGGTTGDGGIFGAIVNAVDDDINSNILSTPSVLALDNESAYFLSGQEIPVTTGEALGSDFQSPFRTVERKDVGIKLEVTPQVSDGNTIRLQLRQEVSSIDGSITFATNDFVTKKREIETTVLADDGEIIVLGGLIEERTTDRVEKIPLLGDIPVVGRAFSNETKSAARTNLMVFLRPTIVRDAQDAREATATKFNYIVDSQRAVDPDGVSSLENLMDELGMRNE